MAVYDHIGAGYSAHRCADPRIVSALASALSLETPAILADVGAGTGNYGRAMADLGFQVKAVEPSAVMRAQATAHQSVDWFDGTAEAIPLGDGSVDGVFCILASHHFSRPQTAIAEMARICPTGPIVWFTLDPRQEQSPWLRDYFPEVHERGLSVFPPLEHVCDLLEAHTGRRVSVIPWPVPHDLKDCFWAAGWRRPEMYLDPEVRACISLFALADSATLEDGLDRLRHDLSTGRWETKHAAFLRQDAIDWGYRFLKVEPRS